MAIITDATGRQLAQAVGGIDTTGLVKDSTLQATNTELSNIDTTGQDIVYGLTALANAVKPDASDIPYDSSLSVKGKIDEVNDLGYKAKQYSTSVGVDEMHGNDYNGLYWLNKTSWSDMPQGSYGYLEVCGNFQKYYPYGGTGLAELYVRMYANNAWNGWKRVQSTSTASITRQSGVSSSVPIPQITRRGNEVIIHFAHQFPAGTYQQLYEVTPAPASEQHTVVAFGNNIITMYLSSAGRIRFNSQQTISATQYLIGQLVYLTDE